MSESKSLLARIIGSGGTHAAVGLPLTRQSLLDNFQRRIQVLSALNQGGRLEALYPNDHFSKDDIAFGYLRNNQIVVASDFQMDVEVGYVAHILMLIALGYAKDENDQHPSVDYLVRGIVKAELGRDLIFWETPAELLGDPDHFHALQECCRKLREKGLVSDANRVYGSSNGAGMALGTVGQILRTR